MTEDKKRKYPKSVWMGFDPEYGTVAYCWTKQPPCDTEYILASEVQKLRDAIRRVIQEGVQRTESKNDTCPHDKYGYEGCSNCTDEFLTEALAAFDKATS